MPQEYDNELKGVLFRNKDKQPGDTRPNAKGRVQVNGVVYWLSAWTKEKDGDKYQTLQLEVADARYQPARQQQQQQTQAAPVAAQPVIPPEDAEDIPF